MSLFASFGDLLSGDPAGLRLGGWAQGRFPRPSVHDYGFCGGTKTAIRGLQKAMEAVAISSLER